MDRDTDGTRLVRDGSGDRLADPPGRIGREFEAFSPVELIDRLDQTEVAFLDQVEEQHTAADVALGDADDKTQVRFTEFLLGFFVALFHALGQFDFLFTGQERHLADLFEVHTDRVVHRNGLGKRALQIHFTLAGLVDVDGVVRNSIFFLFLDLVEFVVVGRFFGDDLDAAAHQRFVDLLHLVLVHIDRFEMFTDLAVGQCLFLGKCLELADILFFTLAGLVLFAFVGAHLRFLFRNQLCQFILLFFGSLFSHDRPP